MVVSTLLLTKSWGFAIRHTGHEVCVCQHFAAYAVLGFIRHTEHVVYVYVYYWWKHVVTQIVVEHATFT